MGAATKTADLAVLTSDNPRSEDAAAIAADVVAGVPDRRLVVQLDRRAAIRDALAIARAGDVVLIAGKGHEQGQISAGVTVPFDDRTVAARGAGGAAMRLTAAEVAAATSGQVVAGDPDTVFGSFTNDTRSLVPGACFVALRDNRDGHDFVGAAFAAGAAGAIVSRVPEGLGAAATAGRHAIVRVDDPAAR